MSRLHIFTAEEIKAFDKPPQFSAEKKKAYFQVSERLLGSLTRMRSETYKIALVLHDGYFKASGRFFKPADFKSSDVKFVAQQLGIDPDAFDNDAYAQNTKIHQKHTQIVLKSHEFQPFNRNAKGILKEILAQLAISQTDPKTMIYHACAQLHQQRIEIPNYHAFASMITDVINKYEDELVTKVGDMITDDQRRILDDLIAMDEQATVSQLVRWKNISHSERPKAIKASVDLFCDIKTTYQKLENIALELNLSDAAIRYYGEWVSKAKLSQIKDLSNSNDRYFRLLAFIQDQLYKRHDYLIEILLRATKKSRNDALKNAKKQKNTQRKKTKKALKNLLKDHSNLCEIMDQIQTIINNAGMSDEGKVQAIQALFDNSKKQSSDSGIDEDKQTVSDLAKGKGFNEALEEESRKLQKRISELVQVLEIDAKNSNKPIVEAISYFKNNQGVLDASTPLDFMDKEAVDYCKDETGKVKVSFYKIRLFLAVSDAIKSGKICFNFSYRYRAINDYLIDHATWVSQRDALIQAAGLSHFKNVKEILDSLKEKLNNKYLKTNENIANGSNAHIKFKEDDTFTVDTPKVEKTINTKRLRENFNDVGFVPIIQLLNEIHQTTGFLKCFRHSTHKHHKLKPNPITLIAGIIGLGCNIGGQKIAGISVGVNESTLKETLKWFFSMGNIESANDKVVAMLKRMALSKLFKEDEDKTHTSSDGMKMSVAVDSLLAYYSFKYFGKGKGISAYTFIDDTDALFYSTIMSSADREASYVIDGLLHNEVVKSNIHSTDTHGYTEFIFAATHLIGTSFAPRIKKFEDQTLYAFKAKDFYEKRDCKVLPSSKINTKLIEDHWDDILRLMVSLKLKRVTASDFFKRLNSYTSDHPLYKAMKEFGRIIKSQFILTYTDDLNLRQRVTRLLNRVELSNKFGRAVFYDRGGEIHESSPGEQIKAIACKTLIQNCIVLWNYMYLSQKLANIKDKQKRKIILESIANGSVQSWYHVNLQGEFDFTKAANESSFDLKKILEFRM